MKFTKNKIKKIELLSEEGWTYIEPSPIEVRKTKKIPISSLVGIVCLLSFLCVGMGISYSRFVASGDSSADAKVAPWKYKINASNAESISIDLKDTIVSNNYSMSFVIPGTRGAIPIEIDFSGTKVASEYVITLERDSMDLPSNLKLYADSSMQEEFNSFSGKVLLNNNPRVTKTIYWEWKYGLEDETSSWANKNLQIKLHVNLKQIVE